MLFNNLSLGTALAAIRPVKLLPQLLEETMHTNKLFATVPFALLLATTPAQAQVSVGVHIDIPIIGHGSGYRRAPVREVRVYEYPPVPYGQWKKHYRNWNREVIYVYQNRYYDYPIRGGRAMYVYRDHDRYFWGPGDGRWDNWDRWDGERNVQYGRNNRDDRYGRDDRYDRNTRDDRYDRNRDGRDDRYRVQSYPAPGRDVYRGPTGNNNGRDNRSTGNNNGRDHRSAGNGNGRDNRPAARSDQGNGRGGNNGKGRGNGRARG